MVFESGALDANLAAVVGDDPDLLRELRQAFHDSLTAQVDLLGRARCDGNWNVSAMRLKGLAASFHAIELMNLAEEALEAAPGDPVILRKFRAAIDEFAAG